MCWPLPDRDLAKMLDILQRHNPTVIGLDLYRSTSRPPGKAELEAELRCRQFNRHHERGQFSRAGGCASPSFGAQRTYWL